MKKIFLLIVILMLTGCLADEAETSIFKGKVNIGPLVPVERPGEKYEIPCEVYQARKIIVYDKGGKNIIKKVDINCNGNYTVSLKPGTYIIDINRIGIDGSSDVPRRIEIKRAEIIELYISIDTGIR